MTPDSVTEAVTRDGDLAATATEVVTVDQATGAELVDRGWIERRAPGDE